MWYLNYLLEDSKHSPPVLPSQQLHIWIQQLLGSSEEDLGSISVPLLLMPSRRGGTTPLESPHRWCWPGLWRRHDGSAPPRYARLCRRPCHQLVADSPPPSCHPASSLFSQMNIDACSAAFCNSSLSCFTSLGVKPISYWNRWSSFLST